MNIKYNFTSRATQELASLKKDRLRQMVREFVFPPQVGDLIGTECGIVAFRVIQVLHGWSELSGPIVYIKLDSQSTQKGEAK